MEMVITAASSIGGVDDARPFQSVTCRKVDGKWHIGFAVTNPTPITSVTVNGRPLPGVPATIKPEAPFVATVDDPADVVALTITGLDGMQLYNGGFPIPKAPMPVERFAEVQARIQGTMPGGKGLYAEATDLVSETQFSLPRAASFNVDLLKTRDDVPTLVDAARRLMRVRKDSPEVKAGLEKALKVEPDNAHAHLLLAMWLWESGAPAETDAHLAKALDLPGGRYLSALRAVARKEYRTAEQHILFFLRELSPRMSFQGDADPAYALLQPGAAFDGGMQPRLLMAIAQRGQGKRDVGIATLRVLVDGDPACIEAMMLLEDDARVRTLTEKNDAGKRAAEANLAALQAGEWRGIGRP
jgi:hypothetical protein